jgi:hypothetical protein
MQIDQNIRNTWLALSAPGMSARAVLTGTLASGFNGLGNGIGVRPGKGMSGMQCSGGPVSGPGDDA